MKNIIKKQGSFHNDSNILTEIKIENQRQRLKMQEAFYDIRCYLRFPIRDESIIIIMKAIFIIGVSFNLENFINDVLEDKVINTSYGLRWITCDIEKYFLFQCPIYIKNISASHERKNSDNMNELKNYIYSVIQHIRAECTFTLNYPKPLFDLLQSIMIS